jgi:hypothetical protein
MRVFYSGRHEHPFGRLRKGGPYRNGFCLDNVRWMCYEFERINLIHLPGLALSQIRR